MKGKSVLAVVVSLFAATAIMDVPAEAGKSKSKKKDPPKQAKVSPAPKAKPAPKGPPPGRPPVNRPPDNRPPDKPPVVCPPPEVCIPAPVMTPQLLAKKEKLGEILFHDNRLSEPAGQACAYCHSDGSGYNGNGDASRSVFEGAVAGRFGLRNPPAAAYASFSPPLQETATGWVGGQFWDGRAKDLIEEAKGPFLNPVEMANPDPCAVVKKVLSSSYAPLYKEVYGTCDIKDPGKAFTNIADAIAAYEASKEVNRFTSKYDWYLKDPVRYPLTVQEQNGLLLFNTKGKCSLCHPSVGTIAQPPLFTDFSYDNLGIPRNMDIPHYQANPAYQDLGLGVVVKQATEDGKFKVPSLRNVAIAPPYGHNGYFTTLKQIVNFYNTRDVVLWPAPEVPVNINKTELGNLLLTPLEEDDIVAFLQTLTDGYLPPR